MEPLLQFTDSLSGEEHVTISALSPLLQHLHRDILDVNADQDREMVKQLKRTISEDLQSRYSAEGVKQFVSVCSFLDPRFRQEYLENKDATLAAVKQEAVEVAKVAFNGSGGSRQAQGEEEAVSLDHGVEDSHCESSTHTLLTSRKRKTKGGLTSLLKQAVKIKKRKPEVLARNLSVSEAVQREILGYLSLPESDIEVDPLNWWKMHAQSFPHLSMLACKYLCLPAMSVPSERLFSGCGLIVTPQRNRLSAETVQKLIFLNHNLYIFFF
ncbi:UNVERIFIED_CONTAM: hypothetical protein FKN15_036490 [Acipenser sinensis]